ncbi:DUF4249 family protein [Belliella kenyensis]|uniref:DUF4249 family protein n=1 Tax=Belliella kenyensis TaxID=1472724 RepID=A0ABV8EML9_9BACT|nr:DUF4249 family protein [Belliella kenyensis]MCH7401609.1 DUF4249 domain-containing protein [Belliella kenyensis]MDN3603112.1 DUF4249 family protein [Belliella kenyensis]
MRKVVLIFALLFASIFVNSCIDEVVIPISEFSSQLVVDGWYGNLPENTRIRLYYSEMYQSGVLNPGYRQANVTSLYIQDLNGQRMNFVPIPNSIDFVPQNYIDPVPGMSYQLVFQLTNGESFSSDFEVMPPTVVLDSISETAFERLEVIMSTGVNITQTRTFVNIFANFTDPGIGDFGYMFMTSGISEDFTFSENDNCACTCYTRVPNIFNRMNLLSNEVFQNKSYQHSIGSIPLSSLGRFAVETSVRTISDNNLRYLMKIDEQQKNTGSIFDTAPFRIKGNIRTQTNSRNTIVLGNFFVFQESNFEKLISRSEIRAASLDLEHKLDTPPLVGGTCTEFYRDATTVPPTPFR